MARIARTPAIASARSSRPATTTPRAVAGGHDRYEDAEEATRGRRDDGDPGIGHREREAGRPDAAEQHARRVAMGRRGESEDSKKERDDRPEQHEQSEIGGADQLGATEGHTLVRRDGSGRDHGSGKAADPDRR